MKKKDAEFTCDGISGNTVNWDTAKTNSTTAIKEKLQEKYALIDGSWCWTISPYVGKQEKRRYIREYSRIRKPWFKVQVLTAIVMTPSLPTFSMAFAMSSPISRSPLADIVPTFWQRWRQTESLILVKETLWAHGRIVKAWWQEFNIS